MEKELLRGEEWKEEKVLRLQAAAFYDDRDFDPYALGVF